MEEYQTLYDKFDKKKKGRFLSPTYACVHARESQS